MDEAGVKINCFGSATRHLGKAIFTWKERQKINLDTKQEEKDTLPNMAETNYELKTMGHH